MIRILLALSVLLSCACEAKTRHVAATQVVVRIDASTAIRQAATLLRIRAAVQDNPDAKWSERAPFELPVGVLKPGQKDFWPVDIPVSPQHPEAPPWLFELVIEAVSNTDAEPLVRTRVLTGFVKESERMLSVMLEACDKLCESDPSCHGPNCQSCTQGHCTDTTQMIRVEQLAPLERDPVTSPQSVDGGPSESGSGGTGGEGGRAGDGGQGAAAGSGGNAAGDGAAGQAGQAGMPAPAREESWSTPERVDLGTSAVTVPVAASNAAGDTVITYRQDEADGFIWVRRFVHGAWDAGAFAPNGLVPSPSQRLLGASPGIDSSGAVQLLYEDGQPKTLWLRWSGEESLPEAAPPLVMGNQSLADMPNLSVTEDGGAVAVWVASSADSGTTARAVYVNRRARDTWQKPEKIGDTGATPRSFGYCENSRGDFATVFAAQDIGSNGAPGSNVLKSFVSIGTTVSSPSVFDFEQPTLPSGFPCALDSAGNATLMFLAGTDSDHLQLYWSRLGAGATIWSEPARVSERTVLAGQVIADGQTGAVAVWQEQSAAEPKNKRIVARRYDPSSGWSALEAISEEFVSDAESVEVTHAPEGQLIAAWTQTQTSSEAKLLRFSRSSAAGKWTTPRDISQVAEDAEIVKLAVDPDNRALIVWGQTPSDGAAILLWSRSLWSTRE